MFIRSLLLATIAVPLAVAAPVQEKLPGVYFSHGDWELVCDNTRTCRAAGYQPGERGPAASVLLTRRAGPGQKVVGQLLIGEAADGAPRGRAPAALKLTLRIDEREAGTVTAGAEAVELAPRIVQALLGALPGTATIAWTEGARRWQLSGKGAAAVLLKMDEFQGRVGTRGALIKPGTRSESAVLKAAPVPVLRAARWTDTRAGDAGLVEHNGERLRAALRATLGDQDYCPDLFDADADPISVQRLSANRLLVSTRCWSGPYNVNDGYWVIDDTPAFNPVLVTTAASDTDPPHITANHKGRGIGDCRSSDAWTWDGAGFIHTASASTGMCKLVAAGGAWELPRIVTDVRPPR